MISGLGAACGRSNSVTEICFQPLAAGPWEAQNLGREHAHQADRSQRYDAEQGRAEDEGRGDRAEQYPCNDHANDGHAGLFK